MSNVVHLNHVKRMIQSGEGSLERLARILTDGALAYILTACVMPKDKRCAICKTMLAEQRRRKNGENE